MVVFDLVGEGLPIAHFLRVVAAFRQGKYWGKFRIIERKIV